MNVAPNSTEGPCGLVNQPNFSDSGPLVTYMRSGIRAKFVAVSTVLIAFGLLVLTIPFVFVTSGPMVIKIALFSFLGGAPLLTGIWRIRHCLPGGTRLTLDAEGFWFKEGGYARRVAWRTISGIKEAEGAGVRATVPAGIDIVWRDEKNDLKRVLIPDFFAIRKQELFRLMMGLWKAATGT